MKKLEIARAALRSAEEKYGLRSHVVREGSHLRLARPGEIQAEDTWELPESISSLFPTGFPRRGSLEVAGRTFLLLLSSLLSAQGAWLAIVGMEDISWEFVRALGMNLGRTVRIDIQENVAGLVPSLASAIDGFDVVLLSEEVRIDRREWERLGQRSLMKNSLVIRESAKNNAFITSSLSHIEGMNEGGGRLRSFTLELFSSYGCHSSIDIDEGGIRSPRAIREETFEHEPYTQPLRLLSLSEEAKSAGRSRVREVARRCFNADTYTSQQKERRVKICSVASSSHSGH